MSWNFTGAAKRLEDVDLPRIGHAIGVGEDELHAFMDVEAAGSGFDAKGRPKMLFEPHIFYAELRAKPNARGRAVREGLAYPKWKPGNYPRDSYPRLEAAMAIDETAALRSASWGLTQILGRNHKMVGYDTPQDMVRDFIADEDNHLESAVRFIVAAKIDDDLRRLASLTRPTTAADAAPIAKAYNGASYAKHNYHGRIAAAHNKWRHIPDTPWAPGDDDDDPVLRPGDLGPVDRASIVREGQAILRRLGYYGGELDGLSGPKTRAAVLAYQKGRSGLIADGILGTETLKQLRKDDPGTVKPSQPDDPGADKAKTPPTSEKPGHAGKIVVGAGAIGTGAIAVEPSLWPWILGILIVGGIVGGIVWWRFIRKGK